MSEGLYIPIEVQEDAVKRAEAQIKNLETALNRVSADKLNQQLGQISTTIEKSKKHISDTYPQLEKQLKQLETQATSTAAKYAAAFGHLGPQVDGVVREMRTMNSTVKELNKVLDLNFKTSEQYRASLRSQTDILRSNSAQQTANVEATKRSVETTSRLRAELQQLSTTDGKRVAMLKARLTAEQALQKVQAEAFTITARQATQAQQLANRQAELNTELGRNNLIVKEQIKGQERQITFAARQATATNELAQRIKYLNTEEGRNSVVLKEQIKHKEAISGLETKRRNELANIRRELKHLSTEEGKQVQILKERVKYKSQAAALEERHTNALKLLRKESAYLNTEEAKTAAIFRENIKYKAQSLAADVKRSNSLKALREELKYVKSAEGQKATQLRESIKFESELAVAEAKRENTLKRLKADLVALNTVTGRKIAQAQQELSMQRTLQAEEAKRTLAVRQLTAATTAESQAQQLKLAGLRLQEQLSQKSIDLEVKRANQTKIMGQRTKELKLQLEMLQSVEGRRNAQLEQQIAQTKRAAQETGIFNGRLGKTGIALANFTRRLNLAAQATAGFRASIMGAGASFGIFTSSTVLTAAGIYATIRAFKESITAGAEFESTMDRVSAVMDLTGNSSLMLEDRVRSLAATTVFTGTEVSQGMLYLGMAGMQTADAMTAIEPSLRLASIGMLDMGTTADIVTNILYGFNLESEQLTDVVDNMASAVTSSNMDIQQLGNAMSYVAPLAREADISLQEVVASLQSLHNAGIKSSRAGTGMRTTMLSLLAPTERAQAVLDKYGITIDDHTGRMRNWTTLLEDFAVAKLTMGEVENLVGKRQAAAFKIMIDAAKHTEEYKTKLEELGVTGTQTASELRYLTESLHQNSGAAEAMQDILEDNLRGDYLKMISAFQEKLLEFYDQNKEYYRDLVQGMTEWIKTFDVDKIQNFFEYLRESLKDVIQLMMTFKGLQVGMTMGSGLGPLGTLAGGAIGATAGYLGSDYLMEKMTPDVVSDVNDSLVQSLVGENEYVEAEARNIIRKYSQVTLTELVTHHKNLEEGLSDSYRMLDNATNALEEAIRVDAEGSTAIAREEVRQLKELISSIQSNIDEMEKRARGIEIVANDAVGGLTVAVAQNELASLKREQGNLAAERANLLEAASLMEARLASEKRITIPEAQTTLSGGFRGYFGGRDPGEEVRGSYQTTIQQAEEIDARLAAAEVRAANLQAKLPELEIAHQESVISRQRELQGTVDGLENQFHALDQSLQDGMVQATQSLTLQEQLNRATSERTQAIEEFNQLKTVSIMLEQRHKAENEDDLATVSQINEQLEQMGLHQDTVNASASRGERLKGVILDNTKEIVQLEGRLTQEAERQASQGQRAAEQSRRRVVEEAKALAQAEQALSHSKKELANIENYNGNILHRNRMLQQGVLLLDDQDYQMMQAVENQKELVRLFESELESKIISGEISAEVVEQERARLQIEKEKIPALQRQREELLKGADAQSEAYKTAVLHKNALDQMYSTIESSTVNLMESGFRDTKSFFDSIVAQFKRMLAELAYQAAIKPIIVNMVAGAGGAMFGSQVAQAFAQSQGVQLGGTDGSAMSMGQMGSAAWNFFKNGGQSSSLMDIGGSIATSKFGQMIGLSNPAATGLGVGVAAHPGAGGFVPAPSLTGAGEFLQSGMGYSPWGMVGSIGAGLLGFEGSGNMVVDTVLQTGGAIVGGGLGAKIGGSLGGPIGAIAGAALGTIFSSFFGGDKSYRTRGQIGFTEDENNSFLYGGSKQNEVLRQESAFGWNHIHINKYGKASDFQGFMDSLVEMDNYIASTLEKAEIASVTEALDGWKQGGARGDQAKIATDFLEERMTTVYNAADSGVYSKLIGGGLDYEIGQDQFAMAFASIKTLSNDLEITVDDVTTITGDLYETLKQGSEGIGEVMARLTSNFVSVNSALETLGMGLTGSSTGQLQSATSLVDLMGGDQEFLAGAQSFYNTFITEEERAAIFLKQLTEQLKEMNMTLPETAADYKQMAMDADLATESGQEQFANLLKLSDLAGVYYQNLEVWKQQIEAVFVSVAMKTPSEDELTAWLDQLKTGQMTLSEVADAITEITQGMSVVLEESKQGELFDLAMQVADSYAYTIELIEEEHQITLKNIEAQVNFLENIKSIANSLLLSDLSPLTPQERLAQARQQYDTLLGQIEGGDYSKASQFEAIAQALLRESSNVYASSDTYYQTFSDVMAKLAELESDLLTMPSVEEQQKAAFDQMVAAQEAAAEVLAAQLEMAGQQVDAQLTLIDVLKNLPVELSASLIDIIGIDSIGISDTPILPNGTQSLSANYVSFEPTSVGGSSKVSTTRPRTTANSNEHALIAELRALRAEVGQLRAEQAKHKDEMVQAQFASTNAAAEKTVRGTEKVTQDSDWQKKREIKLR